MLTVGVPGLKLTTGARVWQSKSQKPLAPESVMPKWRVGRIYFGEVLLADEVDRA